ncbi:MAG: potassium/proton antiporter [Treponema sp.]|jgi:cell volume regulation protein A|nr:potassium/proton antiporter [Treponema sp.]
MSLILIFGIILIIAVLSCKITNRTGLPLLVGFILIGIFLGRNFDFVDVSNAEHICNFALLFIIFTGGFQTNFAKAKPVLGVSSLLSALGTVLTAAAAAAFAYFVFDMEFYAAMLLGAVISATDAASVFSILSTKKLNLKNKLDSVLEIESGSNDPFAYMMTVVFLTLVIGSSQNVVVMVLLQISIGAAIGIAGAKLGQLLINKLNMQINGLHAVLLGGIALFIYGMAELLQGNGFLAVYIGGIILGNSKLVYKMLLSKLFSTVSMLMQIILFIVLGILWLPLYFFPTLLPGLLFALFLFFIARPAVVFLLMKPFKFKLKEITLVSWAGFRGASSIVFATYLLSAGLPYAEYVFSMVFFVCLLSVIFQGSLIAPLAKLLGLVDAEKKILKPIEHYVKEAQDELLEIVNPTGSAFCGKVIHELDLPEDVYIVMIRRGNKYIVPTESTLIMENDTFVIACGDEKKRKALTRLLS